jgi:exodeoxyribonuclease-3
MKLICWNVNSVKQRLEHLELLIKTENPDLILLQEIKCETDKFPYMLLDNYGYNFSIIGQKTFNGVAILSKYPIEEEITKLPGYNIDNNDQQARFVEIGVTINKEYWRIISVYVPNGQAIDSDKFIYKLKFYERLEKYLTSSPITDENIIIAGDFNVSNEDIDVYDPQKFTNQICFSLAEKKALRSFIANKFIDSFRILSPDIQKFSWWDYRQNSYSQNKGLRIDYIFPNIQAANKLKSANILEKYRQLDKPSDHAPIEAIFA